MNKADVVSATGKNTGPLPSRTCNGVIQSDELQADTKGKVFMKVSGRLRQGGMGKSLWALGTNCTQVKERGLFPADGAVILGKLKN